MACQAGEAATLGGLFFWVGCLQSACPSASYVLVSLVGWSVSVRLLVFLSLARKPDPLRLSGASACPFASGLLPSRLLICLFHPPLSPSFVDLPAALISVRLSVISVRMSVWAECVSPGISKGCVREQVFITAEHRRLCFTLRGG